MTDTNESLYVKMRGRVIGPFDENRLKRMAVSGQLSRTHMLSTDGQNWQRASDFPELFRSSSGAPLDLGLDLNRKVKPPKASWHYSLMDEPHGPVTLAELGNLIVNRTIGPQDSVWQEGMNDWVPISNMPQLATYLNQSYQPSMQAHGSVMGVQANVQVQPVGESSKGGNTGLIVTGYVCAGLSLLCLPPLLGLAGFILGIVNLSAGSVGHGIAQILISLVFSIAGTFLSIFLLGLIGIAAGL